MTEAGGPWGGLAAPAHGTSSQGVGNPTEAAVLDETLHGAFGIYSWGSGTLWFLDFLGETPWNSGQLGDGSSP